jgi:multidrug efflux system outer membrane protein
MQHAPPIPPRPADSAPRHHATLLACCAASMLAGCAVKPPPSRAEISEQSGLSKMPLDAPWRSGGAGVSTGAVSDNWLATFNDPTLDALVAEAIANNPDLRAGSLRVEQAAQYVEVARAALRPSVALFGTGGLNMGGGDINSALQGALLGVSWEPDLWGRLRYARNAAEESAASVKADFEFARQSMAAGVARAWFTATETTLQLSISQQMVAAANQLVALAEHRRTVGPGNEIDVATAKAQLATFEDASRQVRFAHEQSLRALELLLGRYPAAEIAARNDFPTPPDEMPAGLPIEMLERRPDLIAAERRIAAAFNRAGEAKVAGLPRLTLNANIAVIDSNILRFKKDFENPVGGVGGKVGVPLYTGGALEAQAEIRTLEQREAVAQYASAALRALNGVETALSATSTLDDRRVLLERAVSENTNALELARTQQRVGKIDMRAVQQHELAVHSADMAMLRVRCERLMQRVNLHLALGGGFDSKSPALSAAEPQR